MQTTLIHTLSAWLGQAFTTLGLDVGFGRVVVSDRADLADFQCTGAMSAAKQLKQNPQAVAKQVVDALKPLLLVESVSVAGPGFLNIKLSAIGLAQTTDAARQKPETWLLPQEPRNIVIDYGGANAAKPLHFGHIRPAIVGEFLKRLLKAVGHPILGDIHWGDWGTHIGMVISEVKRRQPSLPYFQDGFKGPFPETPPFTATNLAELYPAASTRCKSNETDQAEASLIAMQMQQGHAGYRALWQHIWNVSRADQEATYTRLNVSFEQWFGESRYQEMIPTMIARLKTAGVVEDSRGAEIIHVKKDDDTAEIPPLILRKADGGFLYATTDMAAIMERVDVFNVKQIIYVIDQRQALHFEQVFRASRKGRLMTDDVQTDFIGLGTVNGADGKPFKSRDGSVPSLNSILDAAQGEALQRLASAELAEDLSDSERKLLAEQIGTAAVIVGDLLNDPRQGYIFDLDRFTQFEGRTGPYLLYAGVRIQSMVQKAASQNLTAGTILPPTNASERALMLKLLLLPNMIEQTTQKLSPNILYQHLFELCQAFSKFYNDCHILTAEPKQAASWLALSAMVLAQLKLCLSFSGLSIPTRM